MFRTLISCFFVFASLSLSAQAGDEILVNFTVQQVENHVRSDFSIMGGASCLGAELQRRIEGETEFTIVAAIREVCGGTAFVEHYTLIDEFPVSGVESTYRLELGGQGKTTERHVFFVALNGRMLVYPNPAADVFTVRWKSLPTARWQLQVFSISGELVMNQSVMGNHAIIRNAELRPGRYIVRIIGEEAGEVFTSHLQIMGN